MKAAIVYKDCIIRGESFQRECNGQWIPQYVVSWQSGGVPRKTFPAQQYQLTGAFASETAADDFAIQRAKDWLDCVGAPWVQS